MVMTAPHLFAWTDGGDGKYLLKTGRSFMVGYATGVLSVGALGFIVAPDLQKRPDKDPETWLHLPAMLIAVPALISITDSLSLMAQAWHFPYEAEKLWYTGRRNAIISVVCAIAAAAIMTVLYQHF